MATNNSPWRFWTTVRVKLGELTHLGRAWILQHPARAQFKGMVPDPEIELLGCG
jgi:hypothetical protein